MIVLSWRLQSLGNDCAELITAQRPPVYAYLSPMVPSALSVAYYGREYLTLARMGPIEMKE